MKKPTAITAVFALLLCANIIAQETQTKRTSTTESPSTKQIVVNTGDISIGPMKKVKIYIRSINEVGKDGEREPKLVLFDSNRDFGVNDLTTIVYPGTKIVWVRDRNSGVKDIISISPKKEKGPVFKRKVKSRFLAKGYKLCIPKRAKEGEEAYNIGYKLYDGTRKILDPRIRINPPPE